MKNKIKTENQNFFKQNNKKTKLLHKVGVTLKKKFKKKLTPQRDKKSQKTDSNKPKVSEVKNKKKLSSIPQINRKKTKLIIFLIVLCIFLIIIFGVFQPQKPSKKSKNDDEQSKNVNVPSDFVITAKDRRRLFEQENNSNRIKEITNIKNVTIPTEYTDGKRTREDQSISNIQEYTKHQLLQKPDVAEKKTKGLYVANWNGGETSGTKIGSSLNLLKSLGTLGGNSSNNVKSDLASVLGNTQNEYLKQNQQNLKEKFISSAQSAKNSDGIMNAEIRNVISPYTLTAGSIIPITMITGINSDLPGDIVGQVNRNVYDSVTGNYLLIPAGSKVVGKYDSGVSWGQRRLLVIWHRLVLPNGSSIDLRGMQGVDLAGFSGYNDKVDAHIGEIIGITLASTVLNIGTGQISALGSSQTNAQLTALTNALSGGASDTKGILNKIADKIINLQPTIKIRQGKRAAIFIGKDMILKPYERGI